MAWLMLLRFLAERAERRRYDEKNVGVIFRSSTCYGDPGRGSPSYDQIIETAGKAEDRTDSGKKATEDPQEAFFSEKDK